MARSKDSSTEEKPTQIVEKILIERAKQGKSITYGELTRATNGLRSPRFWHSILMQVSRRSKKRYGFDLSILVVSKVTGVPGNGFGSSLSTNNMQRWAADPHGFFEEKTTEIFDYFEDSGKSKQEPIIPGHAEIDFLF
ncbi:MAG: hypothetical protein AAF621_08545 [Pseudomonadota bacterium]